MLVNSPITCKGAGPQPESIRDRHGLATLDTKFSCQKS